MKPQEKAEELISKFLWPQRAFDELAKKKVAKECALIAVEEILNSNPTWFIDQMKSTQRFCEDVRACLNEL